MDGAVQVWIDDPNLVFRRGLALCLRQSHFVLAGESSGLVPKPRGFDVLVFDLGGSGIGWDLADLAGTPGSHLLGLAKSAEESAAIELCAVVVRSELTPESLLRHLADVAGGRTLGRAARSS